MIILRWGVWTLKSAFAHSVALVVFVTWKSICTSWGPASELLLIPASILCGHALVLMTHMLYRSISHLIFTATDSHNAVLTRCTSPWLASVFHILFFFTKAGVVQGRGIMWQILPICLSPLIFMISGIRIVNWGRTWNYLSILMSHNVKIFFPSVFIEWVASLPKVADELLCRTSQANWSPSKTLGWSSRIFCTGNFPLIMVSGGQLWDMEFSWENFCTVVLGMLMFGGSSFPCPSRTVALTRTGIAFAFAYLAKHVPTTKNLCCATYPVQKSNADDFNPIKSPPVQNNMPISTLLI